MTANRISSDLDRTWVDGIRCATQIGASFTQRTISSISMVSISLEDFLPSILLLMVIIVVVVIVMVIWAVVVVVGGVSFIIKLSFMFEDNTSLSRVFSIQTRVDYHIAIDAACVFRAEENAIIN
ncbi:hypothetical protein Tco_0567807 [Tanacetum coccineum]